MARSQEQQVEADDESALTALLEVLCDAVLDQLKSGRNEIDHLHKKETEQ